MDWSPQQVEALDKVHRWLSESVEPVFYLAGYAGTGKTTLARHLAEGITDVRFAAYTGKAASVMRKHGCPMATTIHQLIYLPASKSRAHLLELEEALWEVESETAPEDRDKSPTIIRLRREIEEEKTRLKRPSFVLNPDSSVEDANLIVVDECSMVDWRMGEDLLSFGVPVLVLGDPAQLPPVKGGGFFTTRQPNIMLTEIHRQAWDNPIIEMATRIRRGEALEERSYGESAVIRGKPPQELVSSADQILVGTNDTRRRCNIRMRNLLGYAGSDGQQIVPVPKDKLVCLRNDHGEGLLNGTLWTVQETGPGDVDGRMFLTVANEDGYSTSVEAHTQYFYGHEPPFWSIREAQCFDYGYALTTHKAQGSQWPYVFVFDESRVFSATARQWLYTAVTRASERVILCRN